MAERHRILVADDEADAAHALAELLRLEGHDADAAIGGKAALRLLDTGNYRMAFLDVSLPGRRDVESFFDLAARQATMRSYLMTGFSIGQFLQLTVECGSVQMLRGSIGQEQALAAVREAGTAGIILVASDDPGIGRRLNDLLTESDYAVAHVTKAADVHEQIEVKRVHVRILDLGLRVIDAVGIYDALLAEGHCKPTIIIANGAGAMLHNPVSTGIITKPYDPRLLLEQIERLAA